MKKGTQVVAIAAAVGIIATAGWISIDVMIHSTGDAEFCGTCHTMSPMVAAWRNDTHGGNNRAGFQAECVDCHLPHTGPVRYLIAKGVTGTRDVWAEMTLDKESIDWEAKRAHREDFVYESGCTSCHANLEFAQVSSTTAFVAHKPYFSGETDKSCISCHQNVGHRDLSAQLEAAASAK